MLIKLIKYDIRADYKKYMITAAVILILSAIVRFADIKFGSLDDSNDWKVLFDSITFLLIMVCFGALLMAVIISAVRYKNKMYSDEGYLMNTLPVNPALHIISSVVTTALWEIFIAAVDVVALIIAAGGLNFWRGFYEPIQYLQSLDFEYAIFCLVFFLIWPITLMLTLIFTINFGHLFRSHRILAGLGGYVVLGIISNALSSLVYSIAGKSNVTAATSKIIADNPDYITSQESYKIVIRELAKLSEGSYFPATIANIVFFAAIFIVSVYILKKKINLD